LGRKSHAESIQIDHRLRNCRATQRGAQKLKVQASLNLAEEIEAGTG
jgi:hypothetical protein